MKEILSAFTTLTACSSSVNLPSFCMFLLGIPLDPDLAGMRANSELFTCKSHKEGCREPTILSLMVFK